MRSRTMLTLSLAVLLAAALAGCSGKSTGTPSGSPEPSVGVKATQTTGIIRGVVVDSAIHPIVNAAITLKVPNKGEQHTNTSKEGAFGFQGLDPGTYFVTATKVGFSSAQTSVEVKAGDNAPPYARIQLQADASARPYFEVYHFTGYIECSQSAIYISVATCSIPNGCQPDSSACLVNTGNVTQDNFAVSYTPSATPAFAQSELSWQSTQSAGDHLTLGYEKGTSSEDFVSNISASPVILKANAKQLAPYVNASSPLNIRVFSGGVSGTNPGEYPGPTCAGVCQVSGAGMTLEQKFDVYTVLFYGFRPAPDYSFIKMGEPPLPQ